MAQTTWETEAHRDGSLHHRGSYSEVSNEASDFLSLQNPRSAPNELYDKGSSSPGWSPTSTQYWPYPLHQQAASRQGPSHPVDA